MLIINIFEENPDPVIAIPKIVDKWEEELHQTIEDVVRAYEDME